MHKSGWSPTPGFILVPVRALDCLPAELVMAVGEKLNLAVRHEQMAASRRSVAPDEQRGREGRTVETAVPRPAVFAADLERMTVAAAWAVEVVHCAAARAGAHAMNLGAH